MRNRMYLKQYGNKWYFRRRIPDHFVQVLKKKEFKKSLKTSDKETAIKRYAEVLLECERLFEDAANQLKGAPPLSLENLDVEWAVKNWFIAKYNQIVENDTNPFECPEERGEYIIECQINRDFWLVGHPNRIAADLQRATDQVLLAEGFPKGLLLFPDTRTKSRGLINVDRTEKKYCQLEELVRKALIELQEHRLIRLGCRFDKTPTIPLLKLNSVYQQSSTIIQTPNLPNVTLENVIEEYFKEHVPTKSQDSIPKKHAAFRFLIELVGPRVKVQDITRQHFKELRDILVQFPTHAYSYKHMKNMSLLEIIADAKKHNRRVMSVANVNKRLASLRSLMQFAVQEDYIVKNPCDNIKARNANAKAAKELRNPFSMEQLQGWFKSEAFSANRPDGEAFFWCPLIGLFNGCRMEEILQLKSTDVKREAKTNIAYFDIHADSGNNLKNLYSRRCIPIHEELSKMGFIEFAAKASNNVDQRLFPEVTKGMANRFRKNFSPKMSRYLKEKGLKTAKTSFHSLRHNYKDAMRRAGIPNDRQSALGGWKEEGGVQANYGDGFTLATLIEEMPKIQYPELDLTHLYVK